MRNLLLGASALALALATPLVAQQAPAQQQQNGISEYVVQPGDNLWDLSTLQLGNPELWRWLVEQNPGLGDPSRMTRRQDGQYIVRIYPGEVIYGLREAGIETRVINPVPTLNPSVPVTTVVAEEDGSNDWDWAWWLLLIPAAALAWWLLQRRESLKDPVYSGLPQVPGGIATAEQARERFAASERYQRFQILNTIPGFISGTMMVRYGDGSERPRVLNRQRAYQATIRLENGQTENVYMLQQCGNDLRSGGVSRYLPGPGFNFEPDPVPEPIPTPEPVADLPSEEAQPPAAAEAVASSGEPGSELTIELRPAENAGDTALVRVTGAPTDDLVMTINPDGFTLRYHPKG